MLYGMAYLFLAGRDERMQGDVAAWRLWKTRVVGWCRQLWRRILAGMLVSTMLWAPASTTQRTEPAHPGDAFGPIHYWQGYQP